MKFPGLTSEQTSVVEAMQQGALLIFNADLVGFFILDEFPIQEISIYHVKALMLEGYIEAIANASYRLPEKGRTLDAHTGSTENTDGRRPCRYLLLMLQHKARIQRNSITRESLLFDAQMSPLQVLVLTRW
jgi:hypothetical protein